MHAFHVLFLAAAASLAKAQQQVTLDYITVQGGSEAGVNYYKGIPFAAPPTGQNRWRPPQPPAAVPGVFSATAFGPSCTTGGMPAGAGGGGGGPRAGMGSGTTSEDCLTINVWTPAGIAPSAKLPVMMWTYGGGFVGGGSSGYNGTTIVASAGSRVVYVSFNYRVGVMGFFSNKQLLAEGHGANHGLLDQVAAYQWVKKYIGLFGGDGEQITAFGQSAGSPPILNPTPESIALQLLSYDGLSVPFQAAIMQSGTHTSFHDTLSAQDQADYTATMAAAVGCTSTSDLMACMRAANVTTLNSVSGGDWKPTVDGVFLKDAPIRRVLEGKFAKVPVIIGTTTNEGTMFASSVTDNSQFDSFLTTNFKWLSAANRTAVATLYPAANFSSPMLRAAEVFGDVVFVCPSERLSFEMAKSPASRDANWRYRWNVAGSTTLLASHGSEIAYVYNTSSSLTATTQPLANLMTTLWVSFTTTRTPGLLSWPTYSESTRQQLLINVDAQTVERTGEYMPGHAERCAFWEQVDVEKADGLGPTATVTVGVALPTTTGVATTRVGSGASVTGVGMELAGLVAITLALMADIVQPPPPPPVVLLTAATVSLGGQPLHLALAATLRAFCLLLKLSASGKKAVLTARLLAHLETLPRPPVGANGLFDFPLPEDEDDEEPLADDAALAAAAAGDAPDAPDPVLDAPAPAPAPVEPGAVPAPAPGLSPAVFEATALAWRRYFRQMGWLPAVGDERPVPGSPPSLPKAMSTPGYFTPAADPKDTDAAAHRPAPRRKSKRPAVSSDDDQDDDDVDDDVHPDTGGARDDIEYFDIGQEYNISAVSHPLYPVKQYIHEVRCLLEELGRPDSAGAAHKLSDVPAALQLTRSMIQQLNRLDDDLPHDFSDRTYRRSWSKLEAFLSTPAAATLDRTALLRFLRDAFTPPAASSGFPSDQRRMERLADRAAAAADKRRRIVFRATSALARGSPTSSALPSSGSSAPPGATTLRPPRSSTRPAAPRPTRPRQPCGHCAHPSPASSHTAALCRSVCSLPSCTKSQCSAARARTREPATLGAPPSTPTRVKSWCVLSGLPVPPPDFVALEAQLDALLSGAAHADPSTIPIPNSANFVAGGVTADRLDFWRRIAKASTPAVEATILRWVEHGVTLDEFVAPFEGTFRGRALASPRPLRRVFSNYPLSAEHQAFVRQEIQSEIASGAVSPFAPSRAPTPPSPPTLQN
ncbi:hypothetical protein HDU67_004744, partial [Dinochytrium kinnereticum]